MSNLPKKIFILGLILLPFVFWPTAQIPYEIPRVWFVRFWVLVLGVVGVVKALRPGRKHQKVDHVLIFFVLAFALVAFLSSILGVDFDKSFWGNYFREDGLWTLFSLVGLFLFLVLFWEKSWQLATATAFSVGSFLTSLFAIYQDISLLLKGNLTSQFSNPAAGLFGNPNFLAGYLAVTIPFSVYLITKSKSQKAKSFWFVSLLVQCLAVFLTFSSGAILTLGLFIFIWLSFKRSALLLDFFRVCLLGLILTSSLFVLLGNRGQTQESRERIIRRGLLAFYDKPILGWGWANFDLSLEENPWPIKYNQDVYVDKAHSHILEVLVTTGAVGLILYLSVVTRAFHKLSANTKSRWGLNWSKTLFVVFILFIVHSQTNVISVGEEVVFWVVLGIVAAT